MEHIKKGCIAVRKSYKKDILFKIRKIIKTKHGKIAILHGITERIEADSPLEDLEILDTCSINKFLNDFSVRLVNGHTESMMLPQINYKGKTIIYMADLLPSMAHIPVPYVMAYDTRPLETLMEKKSFLKEALDNEYILFFEHDPQIECCNLALTEKGIRANNTFKLKEI